MKYLVEIFDISGIEEQCLICSYIEEFDNEDEAYEDGWNEAETHCCPTYIHISEAK